MEAAASSIVNRERRSKLPVFFGRLDGPVEFLTQRLREEALNRNVKLLAEHHSQTWVNVVL